MKTTISMRHPFVLTMAVGLMGLAANSQAVPTNPASLKMKIYEVRASKNSDCSNAASIFKTDTPTPVDIVNSPTLGSGVIIDGTYHCLMFHVSDQVTIVPQATDGKCLAGVPVTFDIFKDPVNDQSTNPDGALIIGSIAEEHPWLYFSDSPNVATTNTCFQPVPTNCACSGPCPLAAFNVLSDQSRSLVVNYDGQVGDFGNSVCSLHSPVMSIR